jgi:hypothetical protein
VDTAKQGAKIAREEELKDMKLMLELYRSARPGRKALSGLDSAKEPKAAATKCYISIIG